MQNVAKVIFWRDFLEKKIYCSALFGLVMTPVLEDEFSFWLLNDIIPVFREFFRLYFCRSLRSPLFFLCFFSSAKNGFDVVV